MKLQITDLTTLWRYCGFIQAQSFSVTDWLAKSLQSCPTLCNPMDCSPPRLLCPWGFSRQEYWSGLPCLSPGDLPDPGIEPISLSLLHWQVGSLSLAPPEKLVCRLCKSWVLHIHSHFYHFQMYMFCYD